MNLSQKMTSQTVVVYATVLFILAATMIASVSGLRTRTIDPSVTIEFSSISAGKQATTDRTSIATTIDGEVSRTAERIGEATALALSAGLYTASEQLKGRAPRGAHGLLAGLAAHNLLPPGLTFTQVGGSLISAYGTVSVRYRPMPPVVEVISLGHKPADGPALIVRIPDELSEKGEARLYIAASLSNVRVPAPFAPAAEVIALGWSPEPLRSLK